MDPGQSTDICEKNQKIAKEQQFLFQLWIQHKVYDVPYVTGLYEYGISYSYTI